MDYGFESGSSQFIIRFRLSSHRTVNGTMPGCPAGAFGSGFHKTPGD